MAAYFFFFSDLLSDWLKGLFSFGGVSSIRFNVFWKSGDLLVMKKGQPDKRATVHDKYKPADWVIKSPNLPSSGLPLTGHGELMGAIGHALSTWEMLECLLAKSFVAFIECKNEEAAQEAFGSILTSKARLGMVKSSGKYFFDDKKYLMLKVLIDDIISLSTFRNIIAHGIVANVEPSWEIFATTYAPESPSLGYLLTTPFYSSKYDSGDGKTTVFCTEDILAFIVEARKLQGRLILLMHASTDSIKLPKIRYPVGAIPPELRRPNPEH